MRDDAWTDVNSKIGHEDIDCWWVDEWHGIWSFGVELIERAAYSWFATYLSIINSE